MKPEVHSFPVSDAAFRAVVLNAVDRVAVDDFDSGDEIENARVLVRRTYPNVQIVRRDEMSDYEARPVWYAFRDGRVRPRDPERERLYASLNRARETLDRSSETLEHSRRAMRDAGYR
jgi:hypothetical protein